MLHSYSFFSILKSILEKSTILISWLSNNFMKANSDKFQTICVGKKAHENIKSFQISQNIITCEEIVTILGITIDFM